MNEELLEIYLSLVYTCGALAFVIALIYLAVWWFNRNNSEPFIEPQNANKTDSVRELKPIEEKPSNQQEIAKLTEKQEQIYFMYLAGFDYKRISEILNFSRSYCFETIKAFRGKGLIDSPQTEKSDSLKTPNAKRMMENV